MVQTKVQGTRRTCKTYKSSDKMIYVLFMLFYFYNHTTNNDLSNFGSMCQNVGRRFQIQREIFVRYPDNSPPGQFTPNMKTPMLRLKIIFLCS